MKQWMKKIMCVEYLKNIGARRMCFVLGILLALIPTWMCFSRLYINETTTLREAVVFGSEKQQRFIFEHYPYKCNWCAEETDFDHWKATFASLKHTKELLHTNCSKLREPGDCSKSQKYLSQKIKVNYFNFGVFAYLFYAILLFYVPFLIACAVQWIVSGFKQGEQQKQKKK